MNETKSRIEELLSEVLESIIKYDDITTPLEAEMLNSWKDILILLPVVINVAGKVPDNVNERLDEIEIMLDTLINVLVGAY